jgi:putative transposase
MVNCEKLYFHVYNRGVEKRDIFCDKVDYYRFLHDLYEFNDSAPTNSNYKGIFGSPTSVNSSRDCLVEIICFCLMPNHYHLLVGVQDKTKLTEFMRKVGTGYTNYFNQKYVRSGHLFQGKYKSILIENDEYLTHLSRYIHQNPKKSKKLNIESLYNYKYSSYLDYIGKVNFPSIISKDFLEGYFTGPADYKSFVENESTNLPLKRDLLLE